MLGKMPNPGIEDIAAEWVAKVDAGALTPDEDATLKAWLDESARHLGAFGKAYAVAMRTRRARALGPNFDPLKFTPAVSKPSRRRIVQTGSIAAGIAAVATAAGYQLFLSARNTYRTGLGETRVISLEDGTVLTLNTNSRVAVNYSPERRDIRLVQGEVLFDVAKNKKRPFIVEAEGTQVRAVGTSFTVKLIPDEPLQVLVREGVVEIKRPEVPTTALIRVVAGTRAVAPPGEPIAAKPVAAAEVDRELVWRVGRIAFRGETLREAAQMFARYSDTKIVIDDPNVASRTVAGLFVSNDPIGFAKAVALSSDLHVETGNGEVRLTR
jgi:transmembrane sensor